MATRTQTHAVLEASPPCFDTVLQVRTGKIRSVFGLPDPSAIFKTPRSEPVRVGLLGCEGDEHGYIGHGGPDKALMCYPSRHYKLWRAELPENAHLFALGGFGENIVGEKVGEGDVCIGDVLRLGKEVLIQVSEPRQPCYMLNHRFELKDMSLRSQDLNRTGWYCRVLKEGWIEANDKIFLVERRFPRWTIANVQNYLYKDRKNEEAIKELASLPELGEEIRSIFHNRLKKIFLDETDRLEGGEEGTPIWNEYRLASRKKETPRIYSFNFEAVSSRKSPSAAAPGSHIRVKLGENNKLVRAYSIVGGNSNRFTLGIALDKDSRGGSQHMHEILKVGDHLSFSKIQSDFPLVKDADQHIFIAGGIGITAFIVAALQLKEQSLDFHLYYAVRSSQDVAFRKLIEDLGKSITVLDGSKGQRLDIPKIIGKANSRTHVYCCGPERLTNGVTLAARDLRFPSSNLHFEAFSTNTSGDPFNVELVESKKTLEVKEQQTLLDVLRDAGFEIPSSCEVGNCGTCRVGVRNGRVVHRGTGLLEDEKSGAMLSCVSRGIETIMLDL
jgi:MOSC domain-containing protein YiiM/ferredoxin-NADP reductase